MYKKFWFALMLMTTLTSYAETPREKAILDKQERVAEAIYKEEMKDMQEQEDKIKKDVDKFCKQENVTYDLDKCSFYSDMDVKHSMKMLRYDAEYHHDKHMREIARNTK